MENDRREDSQTEPGSRPEESTYRPDEPVYQEPDRREANIDADRPQADYGEDSGPQGSEPAPYSDGSSPSELSNEHGAQSQGGQPGTPSSPDRGGGRGGGGAGPRRGRRLPPRNRRDQGRNRRRDNRPPFSGSPSSGGQPPHGPHAHPRDGGQENLRSESQNRPESAQGSLLNDIRSEVERVREVLEGVLRDLEDVAAQLTKAEHEKDLSEAEVEQLREQLRRLHR